jgi:predicted ATPase/DNA-binding SARP family transcriptional activator/Tfp pilus assembly protein PilF
MTEQLEMRLLGGVSFWLGGKLIEKMPSRTAEALMVYLALHDYPLSRETLTTLFWQNSDPKQAGANLRSLLSTLNRKFAPFLTITRNSVAFNHDSDYKIDAEKVAQVLPLLLADNASLGDESLARLQGALDLYGGDFLAGFFLRDAPEFEEWAMVRREQIRYQAIRGWQRVVAHHLQHGDYVKGLRYAQQWVVTDSLSELAHRQAMLLWVRSGKRNEALVQYEKCRHLLQTDLSILPSATTTALYEKFRYLHFPPRVKLPAFPTPFVGRQTDINKLTQQLLSGSDSLITLLGMGGIGKSRLAVAVATQLATHYVGAFLDGIVFVSLEAVQSAEQFFTTFATGVDIRLHGSTPPEVQLLERMAGREQLILLDNFEQLTDDDEIVGFLAQLMKTVPTVKMMITSRRRLPLQQGRVVAVGGLTYADAPTGVETQEAVALFLERAERIVPDADFLGGEMPAISRICQLVEGTPLAIELAAGMMVRYSPTEIVVKITETLDFLATKWHDLPMRQRSLRAVFTHSWMLLSSAQQTTLAQVAVFPATFSATALSSVVPLADVNMPALLHQALLRQDGDERYYVHPLVRQFAEEKLQERTDFEETERRYANFYLLFLEQERARFEAGNAGISLNNIEFEIDNVRRAWQVAEKTVDLAWLSRAIFPLYQFYVTRAWHQEGERVYERAVAKITEKWGTPDQWQGEIAVVGGRLLSRQAWFIYRMGNFQQAKLINEQCRQIFVRENVPQEIAQVLHDLAMIERRLGHFEVAKTLGLEALAIRQELGLERDVANSMVNVANAIRMLGDVVTARNYLIEAFEIADQYNDVSLRGNASNDLGEVFRSLNDYEQAQRFYEQALALYRELGDMMGLGAALNNLGSVTHSRGDFVKARQYANESLEAFRQIDNRRVMTFPLSVLGRIARDEGDYGEALAKYQEALRITHELNYVPKMLDILFEMATVLQKMGDIRLALTVLVCVEAHPKLHDETRKAVAVMIEDLVGEMPAFNTPAPDETKTSLEEVLSRMLVFHF